MAKTREQKKVILQGLKKELATDKTMVFVHQKGLNANATNTLRRKLQDSEVSYVMTRKTLLKLALEGKLTGEMPELGGEIAVAYATDKLAPAREVFNFGKEHKGLVSIVGGVYDGEYKDKSFMETIATIPSREVLLSKFLNIISSPMQRFAVVIDAYAKKVEAGN